MLELDCVACICMRPSSVQSILKDTQSPLEFVLEGYEVLGGLRLFGRMWRVFCMAMDGSAKFLSVCWTASRGVLGGLGEVLGVMLGPKMAAKSSCYRKKCCSKR